MHRRGYWEGESIWRIIEKISSLDAWILEPKEYKERALLVAAKLFLLEQAKTN